MKYLGLAYFTPERFAEMSPDEVKALVSQCPALDQKMQATGKMVVSASLGDQSLRQGLIAGLIGVVVIGAVTTVGTKVNNQFVNVGAALK